MAELKAFIRRLKAIALPLQIFFVALAFAFMVVSSYMFVSAFERRHLANEAQDALSYTQSQIKVGLREAEMALDGMAQTVRSMLIMKIPPETIRMYLTAISDSLFTTRMNDYLGIHAYFDGIGFMRVAGCEMAKDSAPESYQWYVAAVEAGGRVTMTDPYKTKSGGADVTVLTYARRMFDYDGNPLGVIAMDVNYEKVTRHLDGIKHTKTSYASLLDKDAVVIYHPLPETIGMRMGDVNSGAARLKDDLMRDGKIVEREVINYTGDRTIVFFVTMENGWRLGLFVPKDIYYRNTRIMGLVLSGLGVLMTAILSFIIVSLARARKKSDEFAHIMFSAMPLACFMWNEKREIETCNNEVLRFFGVSDKNQLRENFDAFSPEFQPCGGNSSEMARALLEKAFREGYHRIEWTHRNVDGEPLPCEVTFIRALHDGKTALLAYVRDLREEKAALELMREADRRAMMMVDNAPVGVTMWDRNCNLIDFNFEAARVLGIYDKEEYRAKFAETAPEFQPDGTPTLQKLAELLKQAFETGHCRAAWHHNTVDGSETIPFDARAFRIKYGDDCAIIVYCTDLRELNAMMAQIQENEKHLMTILDTTPLGITLWDRDINLVDFNFECARVVGIYDKQEYVDRFPETTPEFQPDGTPSKERLRLTMTEGFEKGTCKMTWRHYHVNGDRIDGHVDFDAVGFRVHTKGKDLVILYCRDMTESNAMMAKLREADERAMMMIDASPFGITMWDRDLNIIDCNHEAARVVGIRDKDEFRERFYSLMPEYQPNGRKSMELMAEFINTAFKDDIPLRSPWHHCTVDGELVEFEATIIRMRYRDDYAVIIYCRDMREMNIAIAKMREADERAQLLLDSTPISCTLFDENLNAIDCNLEAVRLVGASDKHDYLENILKYSPEHQPDGTPTVRKSPYVALKALEEGYHRLEWTYRHSNGDLIPCELTLVRLKHRGRDIVAGYARDLREVKEMIRNLHRAEIAEKSNRAKSKFLAAMSHEIRTPMNVILGVAEMQMQDETLAPHQKEALMQIYNSSDLLLGIINDILDLSKIEADKMEFSPTKYELASLISDTASLNVMRSSKPTEFELDIAEDAPACLFGDELRIKQILNNILSNAFKFTDEGTIRLKVKVIEESDNHDKGGNNVTLCMTVADSGQGMTPDQVSRLFTEYTRFNLDTNRTVEGTGLGMNITHRLINMMGGKIVVDSDLGKGTTVDIRLPQKRVGEKRIGRELAENLKRFRVDSSSNLKRTQFKRDYMPYGRVLIVDDVESNLYVAKGLMAPYGLNIDVSNGGLDAVNKIRDGNVYDIIFMDHMMPKVDGIEAARRIRGLGYAHPIVALTANAVVGQADVFIQNGFDDFISKPIDIRQLNVILNRLVRDKQPPEVLERATREKEELLKAAAAAAPGANVATELLAVFARDAGKVLPILEQFAENVMGLSGDDMRLFTTSVHGMKSALANIGESRLSQMAFALEKAGKTNDRKTIASQLPNFIKALSGITAKAEVESKTKDSAAADEDPKYFKEQMTTIAAACEKYDSETVSRAIDELKKKAWTHETEEIINKIEEHLLHSNFDEAGEMASGFVDM